MESSLTRSWDALHCIFAPNFDGFWEIWTLLYCIGFTFWFILLAPETVLVNARLNWLKFEYVKTLQLKVSFSEYYIEFEYIMTIAIK